MAQAETQDKIIEVIGLEETLEGIIGKIVERYRNERYGNHNDRNRNRSRERTFVGNYRRDRSSSNDRSRSGSRASTNRDRIRCYMCRECDHFARDCPNSREERDLEQLQHMLNMEEQDCRSLSTHSSDGRLQKSFKLMNGRDGTTAFLTLDSRICGQGRDSYPTLGQYLTREQAKHICKKVETGQTIYVDTMKLEIEHEKQLNQMDDDNGEVNPYRDCS